MNYINTLPKDLKILLDQYLCRNYYLCLCEICKKISERQFYTWASVEQKYYQESATLNEKLLCCDCHLQVEYRKHSNYTEKLMSFAINVKSNLITKDILLKNIQTLIKFYNFPHLSHIDMFNELLAEYGIEERFIIFEINRNKRKVAVVNINECFDFES